MRAQTMGARGDVLIACTSRSKGVVMSETLERWKQITEGFTQRLQAVEAGQWDKGTPCTAFTVRQLIEHVIEVQRDGATTPRRAGGDRYPPRPRSRQRLEPRARRRTRCIRGRRALEHVVDTPLGRMAAEDFLAGPASGDALIHTWDVARAIGAGKASPRKRAPGSSKVCKPSPRTFCANRGCSKRPSLRQRGPMRKRSSSVIRAASRNHPMGVPVVEGDRV